MSKYSFDNIKREISGFGGGYEETCRKMVVAGMEFFDENPTAKVTFKQYKNITGMTTDENDDCKKLQAVMLKASGDDCTGAMMQACLNHVMYAHVNGWEKYTEEMNKKEKSKEK